MIAVVCMVLCGCGTIDVQIGRGRPTLCSCETIRERVRVTETVTPQAKEQVDIIEQKYAPDPQRFCGTVC